MATAELAMTTERGEWARTDRSKRWRLADLAQFPEENGFRYEIIDGELIVTAAPARPHTVVAVRLTQFLLAWLTEHQSAWTLLTQPIHIEQETETTTYRCEPDLSIIDQTLETYLTNDHLMPVIVIEIVSPGNPENDYVRKVQAYAALGIPEYWIVDPRHRTISFLTLTGEGESRHYERIDGSELLAGLAIDVEQIFAGMS